VTIDRTLCNGHARCNAFGPDVYPLDDLGAVAIDEADIAPEHEQQAREGAKNCPEGAITVTD
jgi:ferredoxin